MKILATLIFALLAFVSCEQEDKRDFQVAIDSTLFQWIFHFEIGHPFQFVYASDFGSNHATLAN